MGFDKLFDIFSILFPSKIHGKIKRNQAIYIHFDCLIHLHRIYCLNKSRLFHFYQRSSSYRISFISDPFFHQLLKSIQNLREFFPLSVRINIIFAIKKICKTNHRIYLPIQKDSDTKKNNKFERIPHLFLNHFIVNCNIPASFLLFKTIMKEKRALSTKQIKIDGIAIQLSRWNQRTEN